ncbi:MAG: Spy/CpxP family protein refolding chaperone [Syntrophales bacterium]
MKKISMTVLAVMLGFAMVALVFAYGPERSMGSGGGPCIYGGGFGNERGLNLTSEQHAKIDQLRIAHMKDVKPLVDQMFIKHGDLRQLWLEKEPNEGKIIALQKEIQGLRDKLQDKLTTYRFAVLKLLTPEQKTKLASKWGGRHFGRDFGPGSRHGWEGCPGGGPDLKK